MATESAPRCLVSHEPLWSQGAGDVDTPEAVTVALGRGPASAQPTARGQESSSRKALGDGGSDRPREEGPLPLAEGAVTVSGPATMRAGRPGARAPVLAPERRREAIRSGRCLFNPPWLPVPNGKGPMALAGPPGLVTLPGTQRDNLASVLPLESPPHLLCKAEDGCKGSSPSESYPDPKGH